MHFNLVGLFDVKLSPSISEAVPKASIPEGVRDAAAAPSQPLPGLILLTLHEPGHLQILT